VGSNPRKVNDSDRNGIRPKLTFEHQQSLPVNQRANSKTRYREYREYKQDKKISVDSPYGKPGQGVLLGHCETVSMGLSHIVTPTVTTSGKTARVLERNEKAKTEYSRIFLDGYRGTYTHLGVCDFVVF